MEIEKHYDEEKNKLFDRRIMLVTICGLLISILLFVLEMEPRRDTTMSNGVMFLAIFVFFIISALIYMKDENYKGKYFVSYLVVTTIIEILSVLFLMMIFAGIAGSMQNLYYNDFLLFIFSLINNGKTVVISPYFYQKYKKDSYLECMKDKQEYLERKLKEKNY